VPDTEHSYSFRLFVTGESLRSQRAAANLRSLCAAALGDGFEIDVVDVWERPELAEEERIIATPTVLRLSPPPARRVVGDLSDFDLAAAALGLVHPMAATKPGGLS
jgi:circadian clock protein KaiB